jgi:N-acetyl-anhydromuramyl-L-alanine amidase AmpD
MVQSPNYGYPSSKHGRNGFKPVAIVHHICEGSLTGTDSWFSSPQSKASAHFCIGKNGEIHQYVDVNDAAWANGLMQDIDTSISWLAKCWNDNMNPNLVTVSIEFEGKHSEDPTGFYHFTEEQIRACIALDAWLCETLNITPSKETIIGHFQIDGVTRANCPGPNFPFERIVKALQPEKIEWNPADEVQKLMDRGILDSWHNPNAMPNYGELSTIINRVLDKLGK